MCSQTDSVIQESAKRETSELPLPISSHRPASQTSQLSSYLRRQALFRLECHTLLKDMFFVGILLPFLFLVGSFWTLDPSEGLHFPQ